MISVALPVRNGARFVQEAVESVLAQDFTDFELVISDNHSSDDTAQIVASLARQDTRIRVSRSSEPLAHAASLNRAVDLCDARWVKIFCHDDLMDSDCLSTLHAVIRDRDSSRVGVVGNAERWLFADGSGHQFQPASGRENVEEWDGPELIRQMLEGKPTPPFPSLTTALVRKEAWARSKGFRLGYVNFDTFFWARLLVESDYRYVRRPLTTNRIHGAQVAVRARRDVQAIEQTDRFWREFVVEFGDGLKLTRRARFRARMKGVAYAGSVFAIEIMKRRFDVAARLALELPPTWWPLLPSFVLRSLIGERRKLRALGPLTPRSLIYPD